VGLPLRGSLIGTLAVAVPLACGCGNGATSEFPAAGSPPLAGGNGELAYAIPSVPGRLDPLAAGTTATQSVVRQIFEPLVAGLGGPYGRRHDVPGVALSTHHSADFRVWILRLRPGVRFQDGRLLDAFAVLANARRWQTSVVGRQLLPGFIAADGPRPDLVRFVFNSPLRDLPSRLADPRLGLVSPDALRPRSGVGASLLRAAQAGGGPFELAARRPREVVLKRNAGWWGSARALGPALDGIVFRSVARRARRVALLRTGRVRLAAGIGRAAALRLRTDPLLTSVGADGPYPIGLERSVRGIEGWRPQPLSAVWLTLLPLAR
jgi:ABC-type transport system substrate-binding protein